jgi:hypothetical protein
MVFRAPATISERVAGWGTWSRSSSINPQRPTVIGNERVELSSAIAKPHFIAKIRDKHHRYRCLIRAQNPYRIDKYVIYGE